LKIDYALLIQAVVPVILQLFEKFFNANVVWKLVNLLNMILEKSQWTCGNEMLLQTFQAQGLKTLLKTESGLMVSALIDMFKNLIVSFPPGSVITPIFSICIEFLDNNLQKGKHGEFLRFWLFLAREYSSKQGLDAVMHQLFITYFPILNQSVDPTNLASFLNIVEEYILLEFIKPDDYPNIIKLIETKYELTIAAGYNELVVEIRSSCLSIMASIILLYLNLKVADHLKLFEKLILYCVQDVLNEASEKAMKGMPQYKTSVVSMLNRVILQDASYLLALLQQYNVDVALFVNKWFTNMEYLTSKHACKLNAIAILQFFHLVTNAELLKAYIEPLLRYVLPEIHNYIETAGQPKVDHDKSNRQILGNARLSDSRASERKEILRKSQLFDDLNLTEMFFTFVKVHGINIEVLAVLVSDKTLLESAAMLLKS
jgi:hypothetical protein